MKPSVLARLVSAFLGKLQLTDEEELELCQLIATQGDAAVVLSPISMVTDAIHLETGAVRILRYGQDYDVEFTWELDEGGSTPIEDMITAVHRAAVAVAKEHDVKYYYGGLEPARDENTRFFTETIRGPLLMKRT